MQMNKEDIRKKIKEKRDSMPEIKKRALDNIIFEKVLLSEEYRKAGNLFIFVSFGTEVDTHRIIKRALRDGKNVSVPKTISREKGMIAVKINHFNELKSGAYGILEPENINLRMDESTIDLCYIPGIAFDKEGGRIGYGGGYYDRFLKMTRKDSKKIALAYSFQILDKVPREEHDIPIDNIISD
ncbi:5-formyltetrahydrofolate cyclo-ligase [Clostridiaceae bacterium BL-3]|nr:5-formyltetrahydrofolate cyclo-ligase [Clostridiaceae bacterium BL-3]